MTRTHKVRVIIFNKSGLDMVYKEDKYVHGEIAPSSRNWMDVKDNDVGDCLSLESSLSLFGCSGYVTYRIGRTPLVDLCCCGVSMLSEWRG